MNNLNLEVLKVPLGFIRVVELPFIIIAFASMGGWGMTFNYIAHCDGGKSVPHNNIVIDTFKLTRIEAWVNSCDETKNDKIALFNENISSSPGFFVFTGVVSLLFVLGVLGVYLFLWGKYESNNLFPMIDFVVTAVLTLFWFIGTIAWWSGASDIGSETSKESIENLLKGKDASCANTVKDPCTVETQASYGSLVISVFAGWACVLLFLANCWFVFKETIWFRNRQAPPTITAPGAGVTTPYNQQQPAGFHG